MENEQRQSTAGDEKKKAATPGKDGLLVSLVKLSLIHISEPTRRS
jgi:hypothetical protein